MRELDVGTQLKIKDFFDFLRTFSLLDFGQIVTVSHGRTPYFKLKIRFTFIKTNNSEKNSDKELQS